jgi:protein O-mannosyl-transferase
MTFNNETDILHLSSVPQRKCRHILFAIISLTILISIIYSNSLDCSWHFDDMQSIKDNPNIHMEKLSWEYFYNAFHSDPNNPHKIYRPISCLSLALNYYYGELNVFGYHVVNISVHLIASVFLFLFIYKLFDLPLLKDKYNDSSYFIALLATVLWAANPIQGQAITYIVQRMASMAGMFYIMAMYFYLCARTVGKGAGRAIFFLLSLTAFFLSLGSKENGVMLPFSLLGLELFLLNSNLFHHAKKNYIKAIVILFFIIFVSVLYIFLKNVNLYEILISGYDNRPFTLGQRLLTETRVIIFYISLILYPVSTRLNINHDIDLSISLFNPVSTMISILIIAATIGFTIYRGKRYPLLAFSVCFFLLNHFIESFLLNLELIYEHRNYIPSMFLFLPIAAGLSKGLDLYKTKKSMRYVIIAFIILFLVGLGHSTFIRNFTWKNEKSLWIDAVDKSPDLARPHHNLAKYFDDHGYKEEALSEYMKALTLKWTNRKDERFTTYYNLGLFFTVQKDFTSAIDYYNKALQIKTDFAGVYNNLATIYYNKNEDIQAHKYLEKAFALSPYNPFTNINLALYFLKIKEPSKALFHLNRVTSNELFIPRQSFTGIAYKQMQRYGMAVTCFRNVVEKDSDDLLANLNLAEIYHITGQMELSRRYIDKALLIMFAEDGVYKKTLDNLNKKNADILYPSNTIIIPLIKASIIEKNTELNSWLDYIKKFAEESEKHIRGKGALNTPG